MAELLQKWPQSHSCSMWAFLVRSSRWLSTECWPKDPSSCNDLPSLSVSSVFFIIQVKWEMRMQKGLSEPCIGQSIKLCRLISSNIICWDWQYFQSPAAIKTVYIQRKRDRKRTHNNQLSAMLPDETYAYSSS